MKTLLLVRHAKSDWGDPGLDDHDRRLNPRGLRDAPRMGRHLAERGVRPDILLASTALRAATTARLIASELGVEVTDDGELYAASARTLLARASAMPDTAGTVMLVAHNPGISELARRFDHSFGGMPTCAVAQFTFDIDHWDDLPDASPTASRFDQPAALPE